MRISGFLLYMAKKPTAKKVKESALYHVNLKFNDTVYDFDTNDIAETFLSVAPEFLKTKVIAFVTKDGKTLERVVHLPQAKKLFWNKYTLEAFIKNLIF